MATRELMKAEALARMGELGLSHFCKTKFENRDWVCVSEDPYGFVKLADYNQERFIRDFEKQYNVLVYHIIRKRKGIEKQDDIFFVSDDDEEWDFYKANIRDGLPIVYSKDEGFHAIKIGHAGLFDGLIKIK